MKFKRAYIKVGPYQPILSEYPASNSKKNPQYSPSKDEIFCLPCFLFNSNPSSRFGSTTFTHNGFSNWKKVHDGCNCAFLTHMGKDSNLLHNNEQRAYVDLMNQAQHIEVSLDRQTTQQISANRLRLKTRCAFRGHDESSGSKNCGNFLELLSLLALYDEKVEDILKSAPKNASYTSSTIQKEILQIYANRVRNVIREEIGDRKFSIIMDEARDESKKEQMTIILKFADKQRQVKEQFFDIVHVKYTASLTLKNVIFNVLLQHSYDGASNIRGEFNVLQALILNDCRYAYSVQCFAHQVVEGHQLFKDLSDIVNIASTSSKRHDELQKAQAAEITRLVSINDYIKKEDVTVEHHYQVDIFFATIDTQLQELKSRFNENVVELLTFTTALDHNELFKLFDINKICILVNKFYPEDFSQQEKECLPYELKHYELDVCKHPNLRKISTLSELCKSLVENGKSVMYPLVDRLICLILTLPVSTATSRWKMIF
ncbi:hypothetical protein V6Z11_D10G189000 [Gossypium hirsutum]